jgi:hypothetical protein
MRPRNGLLLLLDRTAVLFLGLAVGGTIAMSFLGGGDQTMSRAQASIPAPPAPIPPRDQAAVPGARLAAAIAHGRRIEIGVFGDSFGDGIWAGLYNQLRRDPRFEVRQYSERSTGFTRYRSLNLLDDIRAKLDREPVDIAIVSFGANDTQGIFSDGHGFAYMSEGWQRIVTERVTAVVQLLRERGVTVYWVGLPKMRDLHFDTDIEAMNRFYAARMAALGVPYVETAPMSVDADGHYAPYLPVQPGSSERQLARANDGIHMTIPGYIYLTRGLAQRLRAMAPEARAEARPAGPGPGRAGRSAGAND